MLSQAGKTWLTETVRKTLTAVLDGNPYTPEEPEPVELKCKCGCFVTFKTNGQLRGCLGCFTSDEPLYMTVVRMATDSITQDPRFVGNRMTAADLPRITFDISVLSPLEPTDNPENIELGRHGIYVRQGARGGCFLPQVATETGWSVEEFWGNCCSHKAGLPPDAWKGPDIDTLIFTADVIEAKAIPDLG